MTDENRLEIERICRDVLWNEPMFKHTTFRIGGAAECFVSPSSAEGLVSIVKYCDKNNIPFYVVGNGSNLLIHDDGINGVVIHVGRDYGKISMWDGRKEYLGCPIHFNKDIEQKSMIVAQSGAALSAISAFALKQSLTGMEFASGIPGTVGGGLIMNAGAYDGEISQVCVGSVVYDVQWKKTVFLSAEEQDFGYRTSVYQNRDYIILMGFFALENGDEEKIREKINDFTARRKEKQPIDMPSAGSTFKRPKGAYAAKLIEECGMKGVSIGGAQVSSKHSGFIVNTGNATCQDVLELIDRVQTTVKEQSGFCLEPEIKIIR